MTLVTVRIPELPAQASPSLDDKVPLWVAADNKTRHVSVTDLRTLILTGGSESYAPVYIGGSIIYKVPEAEAGGQTAAIPALAGKSFILRREGRALIPQQDPEIEDAEYEILSGGGFKLLQTDDVLIEGERFELDVFSLQGGAPAPPTTGGGSLINGVVPVTTNLTLNPTDHLNKLIQIRADATQITLTLPDIDDIPANTIIPIETTILNSFQNKIQTQGGQYIYSRNASVTSLYMGISESLWLYRGEDGYYIINDWAQILERVGKIEASYKISLNEVAADGSLLQRALHPRLWAEVQTMGASLVSETTWQTASVTVAGRTVPYPYRGCYSTGDGTSTFRVPDLRNLALRGVRTLTGSDTERHLNQPGGFQLNEVKSHQHDLTVPPDKTAQNQEGNGKFVGGAGGGPEPDDLNTVITDAYGGTETRMDNSAIIWTIKE